LLPVWLVGWGGIRPAEILRGQALDLIRRMVDCVNVGRGSTPVVSGYLTQFQCRLLVIVLGETAWRLNKTHFISMLLEKFD
jgi:hypothetical protein